MRYLKYSGQWASQPKHLPVGLFNFLMLFFVLNISCKEKVDYKSPEGYDLAKPEKFIMPEVLLEISGITLDNGDGSRFYALQDEDGRVFQYRPADKKTTYTQFSKHGDYEDLAIANNQCIILRSDGRLFTFPLSGMNSKKIEAVQEWKDLLPKAEYEGIYADNDNGLVYIICKECKEDKDSKSTGGYIFSISEQGKLAPSGRFEIKLSEIASLLQKKKVNFKPSALAKNLRTREWYILSSINKQLVIADEAWKVKEVYPINFGPFLQPEGIAFDSEYNLYISNEGDDISNGNILKFKFSNP